MFRIVLTVIQIFSAFAIVGLVLLQRGKGADAGAGFGAGASGTVFGARGASTALSRATAIFAAVFMLNSLALAYMGTKQAEQPKSILDQAVQNAPAGATNPTPPPATVPAPAASGATPGSQSTAPAGAGSSEAAPPVTAPAATSAPKGEGSVPPPK